MAKQVGTTLEFDPHEALQFAEKLLNSASKVLRERVSRNNPDVYDYQTLVVFDELSQSIKTIKIRIGAP